MSGCPGPVAGYGVVRNALGAVDCHVQLYSEAGYHALTGSQSFFPTALTGLLTLYVAVLGYRLMFGIGQQRLSDAPVIALKIGVILSLTLNWTTFQTLVFDLALKAPLEVAQLVAAPAVHSGAALAVDPVAGLQVAYDQLGQDATALAKLAGPDPQALRGGAAAAADGLWKAQGALFMSTAGLLAIATIAVGVLITVGPVFIALFLFESTRGVFAGWVRATLGAALVPMVCWLTTTVLLVVLEPALVTLARSREAGQVDTDTATLASALIFIFAAAQAALSLAVGIVAGGFRLTVPRPARGSAPASTTRRETLPVSSPSRADRLAQQLQTGLLQARPAVVPVSLVGERATAGPATGPAGSGSGSARLGADYRRDAFLDRFRSMDRSPG